MAHIEKYTKVNAISLFRHIERTNENYSNKEIDKERTQDNYSLMPIQKGAKELLEERMKEITHSKRKDLKCLASIVITLPEELKYFDINDQQKDFFKACNDFIVKDFGQENLIYSQVHLDETTPHIHIGVIPTVWDKEKQQLKICAKEKLNKEYFTTFHKRLNEYVDKDLKVHVSLLKDDGITRDKDLKEYKKNANTIKLEREIKKLENENYKLNTTIHQQQEVITHVKLELKEKDTLIKKLEKAYNNIKEKLENAYNKIQELFNHNWENEQIIKNDKTIYKDIKQIEQGQDHRDRE